MMAMNMGKLKMRICAAILMAAMALVRETRGGPPFVTDDPEPVEYRHWEVYAVVQLARDPDGWSGNVPHLEVNYGAITNLQLHLIAPLAFVSPRHEAVRSGYGDTELGAKFRFLNEMALCPQLGLFPLVELPTGDSERGLGSGQTQVFLPLWLQKSFGPWTTYGGGGVWINPGAGNKDWWQMGWLLQRQMTSFLTLGAEVFHSTPAEEGGQSGSGFNAGGIIDFNEIQHLLFSAGHSFQGPSQFECYLAYQLTFGPKE